MLHDLEMAQLLGARKLHILSFSKLIVYQVHKHYEAKNEQMGAYLQQVRQMIQAFQEFRIERISQD